MDYLDAALGTTETPQSEPIPGSTQVANNAGGFAWSVDDRTRVRRFLILGSEGGTYYQRERELTKQNIAAGLRMLAEDGAWLVNEIVSVSLAGRAPKVNPTIFLLAAACNAPDLATRRAAFRAIPVVCRTGTHLFTFCRYVEQFRGWGRGLKSAVAAWYFQDTEKLALQVVKYRQREGWSHRDVLRLTHPKTKDARLEAVWRFALGLDDTHWPEGQPEPSSRERVIFGFMQAQASPSPKHTAELVTEYGLPREAVKPEHLTDAGVWEALLHAGEHGMPMHALVRNLGNMSKAGLLDQMSANAAYVVQRLRDQEQITRSRLHPLGVLTALMTYGSGHGYRGSGTWDVNGQIVDALDGAFYLAFGNVQPTGKPTMLALDVSGSMAMGEVGGVPGLTPRVASAAMALVTAAVEPNYGVFGFSRGFVPLDITPRMRLTEVVNAINHLPFDRTDCAQPMLYALRKKVDVDTFVTYTDSETWAGSIHPQQALAQYRSQVRPGARSAIVGMVSNGFSIADPNDAGMLDLVGMDTATPELIRAFGAGELA